MVQFDCAHVTLWFPTDCHDGTVDHNMGSVCVMPPLSRVAGIILRLAAAAKPVTDVFQRLYTLATSISQTQSPINMRPQI
jgi:hypothetical protein